MFYVITFHETDGNDATVYESVIEAASESHALDILSSSVEFTLEQNGTAFVPDGSEFGYYFTCPEDCEFAEDGEACGAHGGGIVLRDVEGFDTEREADEALRPYHVPWIARP